MRNVLMMLLVAVCAMLGTTSNASAVLFSDGFENQPSADVSTLPYSDPANVIDATPAGWWEYSPSSVPDKDIQVTNNTSDPAGGAYAGSNCLRIVRNGDQASILAPFALQTGGLVHAEAMIKVTLGTNGWQGGMWLTGSPADNDHNQGLSDARSVLMINADGVCRISENDFGNNPYYQQLTSGWNKIEMDVNLDTQKWVLTVNGVAVNNLGFNQAGNTIQGLVFFGVQQGTTHFFVDNVLVTPEPVSMVLLGLGAVMLRRKA